MQHNKPPRISARAADAFRSAYKEEFGECLSDEQASRSAENLLRFFDVLL